MEGPKTWRRLGRVGRGRAGALKDGSSGSRRGGRRGVRRSVGLAIGTVSLLVIAGAALAFQPLPLGGLVNDDLASGINKAISVSGQDPTNAEVVGGALTAGKPAVPWAIFRQQETNGSPPPRDQVFVRSFAANSWTTRGVGTVGGREREPDLPRFAQLQSVDGR